MNYTSIEQSKKLAEILPLESADMRIGNYVGKSGTVDGTNIHYYTKDESFGAPEIIYAWSLAALLDILSKSAYFINEAGIAELSSIKATKWCICILNCGKIGNCYADNPIDACVAMIEKLHELKML